MALVPIAMGQLLSEVTVRFSVFSAEPIEDVWFVPKPEAPKAPVIFYPTARSPRYTYQGGNPLRFYRIRADGGEWEETVGEILIPAEVKDALLLFSPVTSAVRPQYRVYLIDDGIARHAPGAIGIVNFSDLPLSGVIAGKEATLKAGLNPPFRIGRSAKVILRTAFRGRSYQAYADTIDLGPVERALLILFPPYRTGSLEVQSRLLIDETPARPQALR